MTERVVNQRVFLGTSAYAGVTAWIMVALPDLPPWQQFLAVPFWAAYALSGLLALSYVAGR